MENSQNVQATVKVKRVSKREKLFQINLAIENLKKGILMF
jgi:hypothetical protein